MSYLITSLAVFVSLLIGFIVSESMKKKAMDFANVKASIYISTSHFENVDEIKNISAVSHYGTGLLTAIITFFVELLGIENTLLNDKIIKAQEKATYKLKHEALSLQATGIMNFHVQISGLTVYVYGTAYRSQIDDVDEYDE